MKFCRKHIWGAAGAVLILCTLGVVWLWRRETRAAFVRLPFAVETGTPLHYDETRYSWRAVGEDGLGGGRAISRGRGVEFRGRSEFVLRPGVEGRKSILFSLAAESFDRANPMSLTVVLRSAAVETVLHRYSTDRRLVEGVSSTLTLRRDDTLRVRAEGWGAVMVGDAVVADIVPPHRRRYVFVIAPDTFRGDRIGARRHGIPLTPHLDAFRRDAVTFTGAAAAGSWTLPSFISLFSGQYEFRHQVTADSPPRADEPHLLAALAPQFPVVQFNDGGWLSPTYGFARHTDFFTQVSHTKEKYGARNLFARARQFMEETPLPRLFLFLHTYKLHSPYEPSEEFLARLHPPPREKQMANLTNEAQFLPPAAVPLRADMEALYDGEVMQFDHYFGEFIAYLKRAGIYDRSTIVLLSDHGEEFGDHGGWFHGHSHYQEVARVPLLIKFPDGRHAGRLVSETVSLCDALPTVLDTLGLKAPPGLDGISLLPLLAGKTPANRVVASSTTASRFNPYLPQRFALFSGRYKLIYNFELSEQARIYYQSAGLPPPRPQIELYDLVADPLELHNIAAREKNLVNSLRPEVVRVLQEIRKNERKAGDSAMPAEDRDMLRSLGYL